MGDVKRRERLCKWLSLLDCDISMLTGLIPDVILIAADYAVSLEHVWNALPRRLRRKTCACASMPSNTLAPCQCFGWMSQHVGSIYTLGNSTASEFTIKLTNTEGGRWWLGILWSTSEDGFQQSRVDEKFDSLTDVAGLDALVISYQGHIQWFGKTGYHGQKLIPSGGFFPENPVITVRIIHEDANSETPCDFIEFDMNEIGCASAKINVHRCYEGRPFIQFDREASLSQPPITCTIQTPLFSSR